MAKVWLEHIHLVTPDPMKLAAFYEKVFGAKITRTGTFRMVVFRCRLIWQAQE